MELAAGNLSEGNASWPEPSARERGPLFRIGAENFATLVVFGLIFALGVLGNSLVITVLARSKPGKPRSTTNLFILNLSIADLAYLLFCIPFQATVYALPTWVLGAFICKVSRNALLGVGCIWALSIAMASPVAYHQGLFHPRASNQTFCWEQWPDPRHKKAYVVCTFVFGYLLPLLLISFCYAKVRGGRGAMTREGGPRGGGGGCRGSQGPVALTKPWPRPGRCWVDLGGEVPRPLLERAIGLRNKVTWSVRRAGESLRFTGSGRTSFPTPPSPSSPRRPFNSPRLPGRCAGEAASLPAPETPLASSDSQTISAARGSDRCGAVGPERARGYQSAGLSRGWRVPTVPPGLSAAVGVTRGRPLSPVVRSSLSLRRLCALRVGTELRILFILKLSFINPSGKRVFLDRVLTAGSREH
ncbi:hypothetical protein P7K49_027912 [Saguinus oedipus]|uniref:G-protein coupled receptors family 1 profile domain-containing protein n=1 Tax=Saguinus oedipus TaxID=9490 RepID=A0ABQ9UAR6_SAGOE|nr:hypothetical protein P7K49_027912 [Saguinus oedipus]